MVWHIIRPSILRVSNVFFRALKGRGKMRETSKMLGRIICQTIQWDFYYMTSRKRTFSAFFLRIYYEAPFVHLLFNTKKLAWFNDLSNNPKKVDYLVKNPFRHVDYLLYNPFPKWIIYYIIHFQNGLFII